MFSLLMLEYLFFICLTVIQRDPPPLRILDVAIRLESIYGRLLVIGYKSFTANSRISCVHNSVKVFVVHSFCVLSFHYAPTSFGILGPRCFCNLSPYIQRLSIRIDFHLFIYFVLFHIKLLCTIFRMLPTLLHRLKSWHID